MANNNEIKYIITVDSSKVAPSIEQVTTAMKGMGVEVVDATQKASNAMNQHISVVDKLAHARREDMREQRAYGFVLSQTMEVVGTLSLGLTALGAIGNSNNKWLKDATNVGKEGIVAFMGLNQAMSLIGMTGPWGKAISIIGSLGIALAGVSKETEKTSEVFKTQTEIIDALSKAYDGWTAKLHGTRDVNIEISKAEAASIGTRLKSWNAFYNDLTKGTVKTYEYMGKVYSERVKSDTEADKRFAESKKVNFEAAAYYQSVYNKAISEGKSKDEARKLGTTALESAIGEMRTAQQAANAVTVEGVSVGTQYGNSLVFLKSQLQEYEEQLQRLDVGSIGFADAKRHVLELKEKIAETEKIVPNLVIQFRKLGDGSFGFTTMGGSIQNTIASIKELIHARAQATQDEKAPKWELQESDIKAAFEREIRDLEEKNKTELQIINEWEQQVIDSQYATEDQKTRATRLASAERAKIELDQTKKTVMMTGNFLKQGISMVNQAYQQSYQANIDRIETERDSRLNALDAEIAAAGDNEEKKNQLLAKRKAIEDQYNRQIREEKTRAWEADKAAKIANAIMETAVAVVEALPNVVLAAIVGGMGAAQVALIASQPTPKFAQGGQFTVPSGYEGDKFPMLVSSGERVTVETPQQQKRGSGNVINVIFNSPVPSGTWVRKSIQDAMRNSGINDPITFLSKSNKQQLVIQ